MYIKTEFPRTVTEIEHIWISLSDGTRLAARIWLPTDAEDNPVPAILEYIPYRRNDFTALRDSVQHPYFAGHGYACVRVDMRGSGDSDGILYDEYLKQEQDDALEVIDWIAQQSWCTGAVGMMGISWGGFNGLQVAARRPEALKAIVTVCSTDDRYADDVHYMGGCILASDMLIWASIMLAYNARPPDPHFAGELWREQWLKRLAETPPFIEAWLTHQHRDKFWKHGSVCENFADITCPVYAVGGWADGYSNPVFRLLAGLPGPRKGLIGPWAHLYPEIALPGPQIGFLQESLRWWDHWLKGINTGIMAEPELRVWMQESIPPQTHYDYRPGRWVAEPAWPSAHIQPQTYYLIESGLDTIPADETQIAYLGSQTHGLDAGLWWASGQPGDLPSDQRYEDGQALTFTSTPLENTVEILGFPELTLTITVDRPKALLAVRLCDVAPDGASTLISRGLLNLTHRESHEFPSPLEPGHQYTLTIRLNGIAHSISAGHRWRVAISPTYWPHAWPSPEPVTLTLFTGQASYLTLPTRPPRSEDKDLAAFEPAEGAAHRAHKVVRPNTRRRTIQRDLVDGSTILTDFSDSGCRRLLDNGLEFDYSSTDIFTIVEGDPLSAGVRCERTAKVGRAEWQTKVETSSHMTADAENFHVTNVLNAYEGNTRVFTKSWTATIPRDLV